MKTTIKIAYVNQPKEGKKKGNVKTEDGRYFGVWPDKLSQFTPGKTYEVEYETSSFKGKEYQSIKSIIAESTSQTTNGSNGTASNGNGADGMAWGNAKNAAAQLMSGAGTGPGIFDAYIELARQIYAAQPYDVVADTKQVFSATEAGTEPNW